MDWKVYIHTTPNNKKYIGITSQEAEKRWKNGNGYYNHKYFFNAIKRYGWDNINSEIVASGLSEQEAKDEEVRLIKKHDTTNRNKGYNLTLGGCGRRGQGLITEEQKEKLSKRLRGHNSFLNACDILDIKTRLLNGATQAEIREEYGITSAHLSIITTGSNWGYIMPHFTEQYKENRAREEKKLSQKITTLYRQHKSIGKSAQLAGVGYDKARSILIDNGFDVGTVAKAIETKKKVAKEYYNGASKASLIKKYNITPKIFNNYTQGMTRAKKNKEIEKQRKEMCKMREQGYAIVKIAEKFGCHKDKVSRLTKEHMWGIKKTEIKKVYALKDKGMTNREISKEINRDIDFVVNWINKRGSVCLIG